MTVTIVTEEIMHPLSEYLCAFGNGTIIHKCAVKCLTGARAILGSAIQAVMQSNLFNV